jgi:hypothetical protein
MSHFSRLKANLTNLENLKAVLEQDLGLTPKYEPTRISIPGSQFDCRYTLSFGLVKDAQNGDQWQIEGDLWYISRTRLGGLTRSVESNIVALYTKRQVEQQIAMNGVGWSVGEMRLAEDGRTIVIPATGLSGEEIKTTVDYLKVSVGVTGVQGPGCLDITNHLTSTYLLEEQTQTDEFALTEVDYNYLYQ